jgi:diguanylate cyclase (GGDEF)-like protein
MGDFLLSQSEPHMGPASNAHQPPQSVPEKSTDKSAAKRWFSRAYSPNQSWWKSSISRRITAAVFMMILLVQTLVLIFTLPVYQAEQLSSLREIARTALSYSLNGQHSALPLTKEGWDKLKADSQIKGLAIYNLNDKIIQHYGFPPMLMPKETLSKYLSPDGNFYEVIYVPGELRNPYNIAVRIDASAVQQRVDGYKHQNLWILICMSGFVTSVLMLVLTLWLLEPMILLRNNLLSAARDPEKPNIQSLKKEIHDEIGIAIRIANDLIRQNASSLKRLRVQAEDKIHKLAYFDTLTGLPNRTYFLEQLEELIKNKALNSGESLAVLAVDIDHFKDINDTMGHEIGDKLLEAIAKRLVKSLPDDAVVARASADEFTIMAHLKADQGGSAELVEKIVTAMTEPVSIMQESFQVKVSIGASHYPADGAEARHILKNADIALNRAKEEGRDTVRYYSQEFDNAVHRRFEILRDLRNAMNQKELQLYYHPQFDLKTGQIVGTEALLRWWHPDNSKEGGTFIPPAEFIPVAEQAGLIVPMGEFILRTACETNKMWQDKGLPPFRMAVNISGVQFHRGDIVSLVATVLKETGLDPKWLELEVTESVFMENMQAAIDILHKLHSLGVELAVDDFGTGYSSLSYLRQFPIDRLKVDQSFIRNALINVDDEMITKTIITLGHSLDLKVIAEGVETAEHEAFLKEAGCDEVQGFKYTRPIPAEKFWEYTLEYNRNLAKNTKLSVV